MLSLYCLSASSQAEGNTFLLAHDGQPQCTIVVAQEPTPAARLAALELQYHIWKITGAVLPIVAEDVTVSGPRILVGESADTRELGFRSSDFGSQEYMIHFLPTTLILMGNDWQDTTANRKEAGISTIYESIADSRVELDYGEITGTSSLESSIQRVITLPGFFDEQGTCYAVYNT